MNVLLATWSTIAGLALMFIGGLVLWAYGARSHSVAKYAEVGMEGEATRRFHQKLARWFFTYGALILTLGLVLLFWAASNFLEG